MSTVVTAKREIEKNEIIHIPAVVTEERGRFRRNAKCGYGEKGVSERKVESKEKKKYKPIRIT